MKTRELPWRTIEYKRLEPHDLDPTPAPTLEQRIRVAAVIATLCRDLTIAGEEPHTISNTEAVRAVLTMSAEAWARDIRPDMLRGIDYYDAEDPKVRHEQTIRKFGG